LINLLLVLLYRIKQNEEERNYLLENSGCDKLRDLNHRK
jgi:hypothetical protein